MVEGPSARLNFDQSMTSRAVRLSQVAIWLLMRPVLRAALTTVSPTRAGAPAPSVA